jgi:hypothetical protein
MSLYGGMNSLETAEAKFANFTKLSGNGADFSKVGAIVMEFDMTSRDGFDFLLGKIETPCKPTPNQCALPQITSALLATAIINTPFTYSFTATSTIATSTTPTISLDASKLPAGLTYSEVTKKITGTPTVGGTFNIPLTATNSCGVDNKTLVLVVNGGQCIAPKITSALTATGKVGQVFSYEVSSNAGVVTVSTSTLPASTSVPWVACGSGYKTKRELCITVKLDDCVDAATSAANILTDIQSVMYTDSSVIADSVKLVKQGNCMAVYSVEQLSDNCMTDGCDTIDTPVFKRNHRNDVQKNFRIKSYIKKCLFWRPPKKMTYKELTDENFQTEIENSKEIFVVDFRATRCQPCKMLSPIFENLTKKFPEIKF